MPGTSTRTTPSYSGSSSRIFSGMGPPGSIIGRRGCGLSWATIPDFRYGGNAPGRVPRGSPGHAVVFRATASLPGRAPAQGELDPFGLGEVGPAGVGDAGEGDAAAVGGPA